MLFYNLLKIRRPLTSQILVTKHCNMNCRMCFVYPLDKREKMLETEEPTFEQLVYCIEESCKIGAQVIIPFGGEPMLRSDIGDFIKEVKKRNRYCLMYTNGTQVEQRINELLLLDQLVISIDGDEQTHDNLRGKGTYGLAIQALEAALKNGLVCRLHTVLIPETINTLSHMAYLSKKYNVMINYGYCDITPQKKDAENKIALGRKGVASFFKEYYEMKKAGVKISSPLKIIKECIRIIENWPIEEHIMQKSDFKKYRKLKIPKCALSFSNVYIDSDGSVYPCLPLWKKDENTPNIYKMGLRKAWECYRDLQCHQCASTFTIEKSLFYSFNFSALTQYILGYGFLESTKKS